MNALIRILPLSVLFGLCTVPALAKDKEPVNLDVVTLNFTLSKDLRTGRARQLGQLTLKAELENNRIRRFRARVDFGGYSDLAPDFSADLNEFRNKTVALKTSGVSIGQLEGRQMTADGEGTIRFTPRSSLLGPKIPKSIDLTLRRVGRQKKWIVIYESKVLRHVDFEVDKNPMEMSTMSLVMSPPKLQSMKVTTLGCDGRSLAAALIKYEAPELLKAAKCSFGKASPADIADLIRQMVDDEDVYFGYYINGESPADSQARFLQALRDLKTSGLDLSRRTASEFSAKGVDLFPALIRSGQEAAIQELLSMGHRPWSFESSEEAIVALIQVDGKTGAVVESRQARRILELVRAHGTERPQAARVLLSVFAFFGSETLEAVARETRPSAPLYGEFAGRLIAALAAENADFVTPITENEEMNAFQVIQSLVANREEVGIPRLTKADADRLLDQLRAAGARP